MPPSTSRAHRALHGGLDALDERVAGVDVDAGVAIRGALAWVLGHLQLPRGGRPGVLLEAVVFYTHAAGAEVPRNHAEFPKHRWGPATRLNRGALRARGACTAAPRCRSPTWRFTRLRCRCTVRPRPTGRPAFGEALRIAAVRASGRRDAAANKVVAAAAADPSRYVQQYSTTPDRMLKVGFDGRGVEQLLQQAGLPLWPAERPDHAGAVVRAVRGRRHAGRRWPPSGRSSATRSSARRRRGACRLRGRSGPVDLDQARARVAAPAAAAQAVLLGVVSGGRVDWSFGHADLRNQGQGGPQAGVDLAADSLAAPLCSGVDRRISAWCPCASAA